MESRLQGRARTERTFTSLRDAERIGELTPQQWKSGIAAWLGWMFDRLDMRLYTLVEAPS